MSALRQKADICSALDDVRFTNNSNRESGFPQTVMSALPPKADMCGANRNVRFGPKVDVEQVEFAARAITVAAAQWVGPDHVAISCRDQTE